MGAKPNSSKVQNHNASGGQWPADARNGGMLERLAFAGLWVRVVLIVIAFVSALLLALAELTSIGLPGCRVGGGCAAAAASIWGRVPLIGWPTAFIGVAWFLALSVWTLLAGPRPNVGPVSRVLLASGALGSLFMLAVSFAGGYLCPYCIAANLAHLAFVVLSFLVAAPPLVAAPGRTPKQRWSVPAGAAAAALATIALATVYAQTSRNQQQRDAAALRESTAKVVEASTRPASTAESTPVPQTPTPVTPGPAPSAAPVAESTAVGFTGRWRLGPEIAQVRIVVLTDYQCPDCKALEAELTELFKDNPAVSLSIKHFPLCTDCNPKIGQTLHPNACWAARFAEAAGLLGGQAKFWEAHALMFDRGGAFTDAEFPALVTRLGLEPRLFSRTMQSQATLDLVKADIADGFSLGLSQTPMMFINGVELRGAHRPGAVSQAVQSVIASGVPARSAAADTPPNAFAKAAADWENSPVRDIPPEFGRPAAGAVSEDARIRVVLFGDVQDPFTCAAHTELAKLVAADPRVRYEYRHFPLDRSCNPSLPEAANRYPMGCLAARAIEAAAAIKGQECQQRMLQWLVDNRDRLSEQALRDGAPAMLLDETELFTMMQDIRVTNGIAADLALASRIGLAAVPSVWVNGKLVSKLTVDGKSVLSAVVQAELNRQGE